MPLVSEGRYSTGSKRIPGAKASQRDLAYGVIRREILLGRLKHGTRINECDLAEKLGISRTPIREALLCLHGEGMVCKSKGGLEVTKLSPKDVYHQIEFRAIIECAAIRLAATRITAPEIERLHEVLAQQEILARAKDWEAFVESDLLFHQLILKATDNPFISRMSNSLALGLVVVVTKDVTEVAMDVVEEHRLILEALAKGQADRAEELMYAHITNCTFNEKNGKSNTDLDNKNQMNHEGRE